MVERKLDYQIPADADTAKYGLWDPFPPAYPDYIFRHFGDAGFRDRLLRPAIAPDIDRYDFEERRKMRHLIHPQAMIKRVGMYEHHRKAFPGDLVVDLDTVDCSIRHNFPPTV
jgi:hypothetical protein